MKKLIKIVLPIFILTLFLTPRITVRAQDKNVLTLDATENENGHIDISGTAEDGMLAAAIFIYDESNNLVKMQTTQVNNDQTFTDSLDLTPGTYTIKAADYDGGEYTTKSVSAPVVITQETSTQAENKNNPKTYDQIYSYIVILSISTVGLLSLVMFRKMTE